MIIPELINLDDFYFDVLPVWYSELNYYMTKFECDSLQELGDRLWYEYGITLEIL